MLAVLFLVCPAIMYPLTMMTAARKQLLKRLMPLISLTFFVAAVIFLLTRPSMQDPARILKTIGQIELWQIILCIGCTFGSYLMMIGYEWIGLRYAEKRLALHRTALVGFIGYCFSQNLGSAVLTGGSLRYRFYSSWGLGATDIGKIIVIGLVSFVLGYAALAGVLFATNVRDVLTPIGLIHDEMLTPVGFGLLAVLGVFFLICARWHHILEFRGHAVKLPKLRLATTQVVVAAADLAFAATAIYVLLPADANITWSYFVLIYLLSLAVVMISQVPAGIGVLEATLLFALSSIDDAVLISLLLVYRLIYFIGPFALAALMLASYELALRIRKLPLDLPVEPD